jgi:hypothetical protein
VILSLHDKHNPPDDKEIAASDNKDIKCRCPTAKGKYERTGKNPKVLLISGVRKDKDEQFSISFFI